MVMDFSIQFSPFYLHERFVKTYETPCMYQYNFIFIFYVFLL